MFLQHSNIGYQCWYCGKDTGDYVSPSMDEVCRDCEGCRLDNELKIRMKGDKFLRRCMKVALKDGDITAFLIFRQALPYERYSTQ